MGYGGRAAICRVENFDIESPGIASQFDVANLGVVAVAQCLVAIEVFLDAIIFGSLGIEFGGELVFFVIGFLQILNAPLARQPRR